MNIFENKFNYQIYDSASGYWIFTDQVNKKYKFYFRYSLNSEIVIPTQLPKHWRIFNRIAIGIAILIFISNILVLDNPSTHKVYKQYYSTYESPVSISRSISHPLDSVEIAYKKIDNKEFKSALEILNNKKNKETSTYFYMGVAHQEIGEYESAITEYKKITKDNNTLLVEQAEWYIGLCYLKIYDRKTALDQFQKIVKYDGYYKQPAEEIIKKLK